MINDVQIIRFCFMALAVLLFAVLFIYTLGHWALGRPAPKTVSRDLLVAGLLATFLGVVAAIIEILITI